MALNILELLKSQFSDEIVGQLGKFVNEDSSKTKAALGSILPAVLGGLASKGSTFQGASEILSMITKGGFGADTLKGLPTSFKGDDTTKNLLKTGTGLLGGIFGDRVSKVIDWICSSSGIGKNSASSLLGLVVPSVLGFFGKEVKGSNLNATGLMNLLGDQVGFLKNLAPAGLASVLGVSNLSDLAKSVSEPVKKVSSIWKWLLPLIVVAAILFFLFRTCGAPPVEKAAQKVSTEATKAIDILGKFLAVKLPNGVELKVPELGVEKKLISFIEDKQRPVDDKTWFSFDRLTFETGKATLKPESQEQLKNIAEILKAYPNVTIKLGGYTDNTGDPQANLKLSQQRAEAVMADLVRLGVDAGRLKAEGYGQEHPVADNSTEEGRTKNRRIDIRVTGK